MALHPGKVRLFQREVIYTGLHVSAAGISADPHRIAGLVMMPLPKTVGDVWQFTAAVGWIRRDLPLLAVAEDKLNKLVTNALKGKKKRDMRAASKITLAEAGWGPEHRDAWESIKTTMVESITTSYRDRRMLACIFTDASEQGWHTSSLNVPLTSWTNRGKSNTTSCLRSTPAYSATTRLGGASRARRRTQSQ